MSRSEQARLQREKIDRFNRVFEDVLKEFPEARREAIEAMGESTKKTLAGYILQSDLDSGAKKIVTGWQAIRMGSRGGYAAVSPSKGTTTSVHRTKKGNSIRQNTFQDKPVTKKQITRWLERGHGVRKPAPGSERQWNRAGKSGINATTGTRFVKGRMFYSWTKMKAFDIALEEAYEAMNIFTEKLADL